ncbi:MAG: UvrB/UvrC motif-containing protein [Candidatus Nitrosotenuis sp.]
MKKYAEELDFENAIACRDRLRRIQVEMEKKNAR